MIRSRSADSTSSSWLLPSTRRRLAVTMEFSRPLDGELAGADRLVVLQRVGDAEHREAVDDQPALVAQDDLLAGQFDARAAACRS